jgi:hypothetical protein
MVAIILSENVPHVNYFSFQTEGFEDMAKVKQSKVKQWRPLGLRDIADLTLSIQSAHRWR